jgi:hypothetical protein
MANTPHKLRLKSRDESDSTRQKSCQVVPDHGSSKHFDMLGVGAYVNKHHQLPFCVDATQIKRWSQTDSLVIVLVVLQTIWMAFQCLLRTIQGLDTSLLELVTVAYIPLTTTTYVLWFKKPLLTAPHVYLHIEDNYPVDVHLRSRAPQSGTATKHIPMRALIWAGGILPGFIFCGIHLFAWNYHFPTRAESIIWKICSCIAMACCLLYGLCFVPRFSMFYVLRLLCRKSRGNDEVWFIFVYAICRFILLILALISLRKMPGSVYQTVRWTEMVPHFH